MSDSDKLTSAWLNKYDGQDLMVSATSIEHLSKECGVACKHNETTGISQSDCIAYIDQTSIHVAEYHPSETKCVLGSCTGIDYKVPINGILGIYANLDVRSFRYSCVTVMPNNQSSGGNSSIRTPSHTSFAGCGDPETPVNGTVTFTDTTTNSVASFNCNDGFVEATGSNTQTCLSDGSWSSPQPLCEASGSLTSTSTSSSDSATSLTTTTATTSNIENTITEPNSPVNIFIMPCICYKNKTFTGKTQEEIISMLIQETKINPKNTASAKNKLISRDDLRPSSKAVGFAGLGLIVVVFGILVLSDAIVAVLKLKEMIVNGTE
ncbi:uncharacterized protein LOC123542068 [Mercenaria mercenaria]|uniref:uncharacterized protein LOC123542068 n=1 Tax=Mercenaria mercenaria TaxID=6596 RepID=UPI00234F0AA6|nr:uncharacterized protein LOC123542068 [Mercenaria mercenaria]